MAWNPETNIKGPQGAAGPQGPVGPTGATGAPGAASTVPGPQGPQGPTGATGAQGIQGIQGPTGPTGPASPASVVTVTPAGNIAATNVQAALVELDNEKVAKAGDTMTGDLAISKAAPELVLESTNTTNQINHTLRRSGKAQWGITAQNAANNYNLSFARFNPATGVYVDTPMEIGNNDGRIYISQDPIAPFGVATKGYVDSGDINALAAAGLQINGGMEVNQLANPVTVPTGVQIRYVVDGWQVDKTGTSVLSTYQFGPGPDHYPFGIQVEATTPQASIGSDYVRIQTRLEGSRVSHLGWGKPTAKPLTVGFWMRATLTGTYRVLVFNFDASSVSSLPFTINTTMVWQWVTLTFPGVTSATWKTDNTLGMCVAIEIASSSTPNSVGATARYAAITGAVIMPGTLTITATQAPLLMRPLENELPLCLRHYEKGMTFLQCPAVGSLLVAHALKTQMRAIPVTAVTVMDSANASMVVNSSYIDAVAFQLTATAANGYTRVEYRADARL